jgi:hypothetical protein
MPIPARPPSALLMNLNSVGCGGEDPFLCRSSRNAAPLTVVAPHRVNGLD